MEKVSRKFNIIACRDIWTDELCALRCKEYVLKCRTESMGKLERIIYASTGRINLQTIVLV